MKCKILAVLAISLFSANTFSSQVKIISHEFGHSSGAKDAGFVVKKDEVRVLSDDEIKKNKLKAMSVRATSYNSKGKVGTNIRINGSHKYCIDNYTSQTVVAGYKFSLATLGEDVHNAQTFALGSHQSRCVDQDSFMIVYPRSSGNFPITAFTTGQNGYSTSEDRNNATLSVSK